MIPHQTFMKEAIRLAVENAGPGGGGPFGAVVVQEETIIGRGVNRVTLDRDPTAHAEMLAIRQACGAVGDFQLSGCRIYSSCEPCPMCLSAIYWARIDALYFGASQADAAQAGFDDAWIYRELAAPLADRKIPGDQCMRIEAGRAFSVWKANPSRINY